jgi:outer membrane lipoprotein-sorting protein
MPAIRKTRRIISSEKSKSFMGSEFTNADMSKPNLNDYRYKLLGIENFNGAACWKIHFEPINENIEDENGFSKKIAWINKTNNLVQKVEYYDLDGELHKIMLIKNYKLIDTVKKRYFAYYMEMKNVQTGRKSTLKIDKFQMGSSMKESNFSPASLIK